MNNIEWEPDLINARVDSYKIQFYDRSAVHKVFITHIDRNNNPIKYFVFFNYQNKQ